jgi:outer membrane protein assembly factor BamB
MIFAVAIVAAVSGPACHAAADEPWSRWRGVDGAGQGGDAVFPRQWIASEWAWTAELPGRGNASPVVRGGRIFTASADEAADMRFVTCHDLATGRLVWKREIPGPIERHHAQHSAASGSVVAGADGVYWMWGTAAGIHVEAFTHHGGPLWQASLGPFAGEHGSGATPALCGDLLVVPVDHDGTSFVAGLDARTGRERWRLPRESGKAGYATPLVIGTAPGGPLVVLASMAHGLTAIHPETGRVAWETRCLPKRAVSSPLVAAGLVIATCGDGGGDNMLVAVRPPVGGQAAEPEIAYRLERGVAPYVPTPVASGRRLYLWGDRGVVTCVRVATGETLWRGRVGGTFSASPVVVGGAVVNVSQDGDVVSIADGEAFEVLGRSALGEPCRASPAVVGGWMVFRGDRRLYALEARSR